MDSELQFQPESRAAWRAWLRAHYAKTKGVWCVTFKKGQGEPELSYDDIVEEALCFGWVDSRPRALDDARTMLWFTPRKPGSGWSKPNKDRVAKLMAANRMAAAGLKVIERAREDGSWSALDAVEALETPDDLAKALRHYPNARAHWDAFPRSAKRGILEWISTAKTPPTRHKRIQETAQLAEDNKRANQWKPKG